MKLREGSIEPLEPTIWFKRYEFVLSKLRNLGDSGPEPMLRHLFHLVQLAPGPLKHLLTVEVTEAEFEAMLEAGYDDAAALALLGTEFDYDLVRRSKEEPRFTIAVSFSPHGPSGTATGQTLPSTLMEAYGQCMVALNSAAKSHQPATNLPLQTIRSELHLRSSPH